MSSFVITNTGLERAAQANKQGVSLTIAKFVVGSAFGYTPLASDTKIHGDYLYENELFRLLAAFLKKLVLFLGVKSVCT